MRILPLLILLMFVSCSNPLELDEGIAGETNPMGAAITSITLTLDTEGSSYNKITWSVAPVGPPEGSTEYFYVLMSYDDETWEEVKVSGGDKSYTDWYPDAQGLLVKYYKIRSSVDDGSGSVIYSNTLTVDRTPTP